MKKKIVLGMSGGVDSSVSAYVLKKQGYDVIGVFMQNWDSYLNNDILGHTNKYKTQCNVKKDFEDVKMVAKKLNIKVYKTQFLDKYWKKVFKQMLSIYRRGETPNPDVLCNKFIKFGEFIKFAKKKFKTDLIATGHYANIKYENNQYYLKKAVDETKDQTYFLCQLNQTQLSKTIFPIGNLLKNEIRVMAKAIELDNWNKKGSSGICFIGERDFKNFLLNYLPIKKGDIVNVTDNEKVGTHDGVYFYTIGQNKGLSLGGQKEKFFVCNKDVKKNLLYVCKNEDKNKFLISNNAILEKFNWINKNISESENVQIRFRHRQSLINGEYLIKNNNVIIKYDNTLSVTPGQFAVLYKNDICLGGGEIKKIWKN